MTTEQSREIVVEAVFPHAPEALWRTLTTGTLIGRWLMESTGFEPVVGNRFTFQTTPAGPWNGVIACEVLEVVPNARFVFSWTGGHADNAGYGSRLETVVTWTLTEVAGGTRLRLVHSGFVAPQNDTAFEKMRGGWSVVLNRIEQSAQDSLATAAGKA